ncbi:MAG: anaerobic sulfite reductase subunit [Fusobacteriaceae bacterium]|jgi:anaerobic sulfite reductase subunit A|nr:sulfite reductase, subunit [Fusobacteriales bacterium]MDN5303372.1 anaerobic sulfite reductase subunit [Fusobacteriaceae bacterium]
MKISLSKKDFNESLLALSKEYKIFAPKNFKAEGRFSDTDLVRYAEVTSVEEMVWSTKSEYSPKEVTLPMSEVLFYFTEKEYKVPDSDEKGIIIFLRSCDMHAVKRVDEIYLRNKFTDYYYKKNRDKVKFVVVGCEKSFENCFCVSMGTNKTDEYNIGFQLKDDEVFLDIKDESMTNYFSGNNVEFEMNFVEENDIKVEIPENLDLGKVKDMELWREYDSRCVACGRCNFVCPTCTCYTTQDIYYSENENVGERRRVWASCHVDGFTDMAGGHSFRTKKGDRMRFKVMHKISDYKKRFGYHMCVGCGRCDDACPEYISFSNSINKLNAAYKNEEGDK